MEQPPPSGTQQIRLVRPVRVFGTDSNGKPFSIPAHTEEISRSHARIGGISVPLTVGEIVGVQTNSSKIKCQVLWVGERGTFTENSIVVRAMDGNVFDLDRLTAIPEGTEKQGAERRQHQRQKCDLGVEFQVKGSALRQHGRCTDISLTGGYIETWAPQKLGTGLALSLGLPDGKLLIANATVRTSDPNYGMGVSFDWVDKPDVLRAAVEALPVSADSVPEDQTPAETLSPANTTSSAAKLQVAAERLNKLASDVESRGRSAVDDRVAKLCDELVSVIDKLERQLGS